MTPIFSRSWLMKTAMVFDFDRVPVSLRSAWDMSRACRPDVAVAHLAFDLGARRECRDRVDDEDVDRTGADEHVGDLEGLLPVSGWEISRSSMFTPMAFAYTGSMACSASM